MVQLDELQFPSKELKSSKLRTEIEAESAAPKFVKNRFVFNELNLGSRITLKVGLFSTAFISDTKDNQKLMQNAALEGSAVLTFTQRMLTVLREKDNLEQDLKICNHEQQEVGRITLAMQFKAHTFEQMIDEDIRKVEGLYFDPFEEDVEVIKSKSKKIEKALAEKQDQLQEAFKKLDFIKSSHKSISVETAHLKRQKETMENENTNIRKNLDKLESIKELDIQIDLLRQSDHGIDILREIYAKLLNRMNLERLIYEEMSDQYFQIEKKLAQKKGIEKQIEEVKKASEEQEFHIKRNQDMLPGVAMLSETIKSQEKTIQNLQSIIKEGLQKNNVLANREIDVELKRMRHDHDYLQEKNKQLKTLMEMNDGVIPYNYFLGLKKDHLLGEDQHELEKYKKRASELLQQVEEISGDMEDMTIKEDAQRIAYERSLNTPFNHIDRQAMLFEIDQAEAKGDTLQKEIYDTTKSYAAAIVELKEKIMNLDAFIATTRGHY